MGVPFTGKRASLYWNAPFLIVGVSRRVGPETTKQRGGRKGHMVSTPTQHNTLRQRQNGRHFADDMLKCIFLNENVWILFKVSLKFVARCPINNISALVFIMAWRRPGNKPLSEPMVVSLLMYICVTRRQWVNSFQMSANYFVASSQLVWMTIIKM